MRVAIKTLGCKLNMADTEALMRRLQALGHDIVERDDAPHIAIVNSCTVTHTADRKSLQAVKGLQQMYPNAKLIVTGCGAQLQDNVFQDKRYISLVARTHDDIVQFIQEESDPTHRDVGEVLCAERTRANIPVQTGCESMCSYCIIPYTRGRSVNYPVEEIVEMIREKEAQGYQEIVLTGINIAAWGAKTTLADKETKFPELLEAIIAQTTIPRIRLGSVNPNYVDERFVQIFAHPRFCRQLHLSLQHVSDVVLKRMNRPYDGATITNVVDMLYKEIPDLAITTDLIVGFPGETQEQFQELQQAVQDLRLAKLHVFPFSARKGTGAWHMKDGLPGNIKKERSRALITIGEQLRKTYTEQFLGEERMVLFEQEIAPGTYTGWTDNYLKVVVDSERNLVDSIHAVRLMESRTSDTIYGQICDV